MDNSKIIFSYFSTKTYVVTPHYNRLDETVLMMAHKICFNGEIGLIIPKLSLLPLLIWSIESGMQTLVLALANQHVLWLFIKILFVR